MMKRLSLGLGLVAALAICLGLNAFAQDGGAAPAATHNSAVTGVEGGHERGTLTLAGEATEDLPGTYHLILRYDVATKQITGGTWTRTVRQQGADDASGEVGTLNGIVTGGSVTVADDGRVIAVNAAQLVIKECNGAFRGVTGSGTFEGTMRGEAPAPPPAQMLPPDGPPGPPPGDAPAPPPFSGRMSLRF